VEDIPRGDRHEQSLKILGALIFFALACVGCGTTGRPTSFRPIDPTTFQTSTLYAHNCAATAPTEGRRVDCPADPIYLTIAVSPFCGVLRRMACRNFNASVRESEGGMLTDQQIGVPVRGCASMVEARRVEWRGRASLPSPNSGDASRGAEVYASLFFMHGARKRWTQCKFNRGWLHGPCQRSGPSTVVIVGRPNWALRTGAAMYLKAMSSQNVLMLWPGRFKRTKYPGQPYQHSENQW
jgi:hypothetical protein